MNDTNSGYELGIDDVIVCKHPLGNRRYTVSRVTPKFAFVNYNEVAEGKFPRVFDERFEALPRQTWSRTEYSIERHRP